MRSLTQYEGLDHNPRIIIIGISQKNIRHNTTYEIMSYSLHVFGTSKPHYGTKADPQYDQPIAVRKIEFP